MTTKDLNEFLGKEYDIGVSKISEWFGNSIDTVSTPIKGGLLDLRHLLGTIGEYVKLKLNIKLGNLSGIKLEGLVFFTPKGSDTKISDTRRNEYRVEHFWHY